MTGKFFIGLISGTSIDGVDAVLVRFARRRCHLMAARTVPYPAALRRDLGSCIRAPERVALRQAGELDIRIGRFFADAALRLLQASGIAGSELAAIGSHGQTVLHAPDGRFPFSMQLGDPGTVAAVTGITVVADFRGSDLALGGQGAPLVPAFHQWLFGHRQQARAVVNIGGIANITVLHPGREVTGFDIGPGNTLMDAWCRHHLGKPFDTGGRWASSGTVQESLLARLRRDAAQEHGPGAL